MLRQKYMNKYKEHSLFDEERLLKDDEEYILKESRPLEESNIKNLDKKKMNQFIEDVLTDKKLTSILYNTGSKAEIKSYLKAKKNYENKKDKNKGKEKLKKQNNEVNSVFRNKIRREAYYEMRTEIDNYKINQENYHSMLRFNNYKKYLDIKKELETERKERNKGIKNQRIFGFKRAYNAITEKLDQNKEKELLFSEIKETKENNTPIIALPEIKLDVINVYSRLYNNAVLSTPLNKRIQKLNNNKLKRAFTQGKLKPNINQKMSKNKKISFSLKNVLPSNNGKEFISNVTDQNINKCLNKYSGGPQNINYLNWKNEENIKEDKNNDKFVDFYNLEEKNTGNTYLHLAIIDNYPEIVSYFLEKGANINKQNNKGDTPLHIALKNNNMEIIKIIMKYNPALDIPNNEGVIAFELFSPQMKIDFHLDKISIDNPKKRY